MITATAAHYNGYSGSIIGELDRTSLDTSINGVEVSRGIGRFTSVVDGVTEHLVKGSKFHVTGYDEYDHPEGYFTMTLHTEDIDGNEGPEVDLEVNSIQFTINSPSAITSGANYANVTSSNIMFGAKYTWSIPSGDSSALQYDCDDWYRVPEGWPTAKIRG